VEINLKNVSKFFGAFPAVKEVTLRFLPNTTSCLLGPSGCGKTTILRIIAGLERPTSGEVWIGNQNVTHLPTRSRDLAMVFQYPVIYKGLSVFENIELPLRELKLSPSERKKRVQDAVALLGLHENLESDPERFDNGTRQRLSFARAVARHCSILLFDEPITNVDADSKFRLKRDLKRLTERLKQTIVYVTHDQNEAMTLADQIVLLKDGIVLQQDAPRQIYNHPTQQFGGWFLGNPGMSFLEHNFNPNEGGRLRSDIFPYPVRLDHPETASSGPSTRLILGLRPEHVRVFREPHPETVEGELVRKFRGVAGQYLLAIQLQNHMVWAKVSNKLGRALGPRVWFACPPEIVSVFDENERALGTALKRSLRG
jgi:ABC-type sugar transport system ATPase subunit